MSFRKLSLATAAVGLAIAPVAAQAAPARTAAPIEEASDMGGGTPTFAIIAALIIVALAVVVATKDNDDPVSP